MLTSNLRSTRLSCQICKRTIIQLYCFIRRDSWLLLIAWFLCVEKVYIWQLTTLCQRKDIQTNMSFQQIAPKPMRPFILQPQSAMPSRSYVIAQPQAASTTQVCFVIFTRSNFEYNYWFDYSAFRVFLTNFQNWIYIRISESISSTMVSSSFVFLTPTAECVLVIERLRHIWLSNKWQFFFWRRGQKKQ